MLAKINHHSCYSAHAEKNSTDTDHPTEQWLSFQELKGRLGKLVTALPEKYPLVFQLSRDAGLSLFLGLADVFVVLTKGDFNSLHFENLKIDLLVIAAAFCIDLFLY